MEAPQAKVRSRDRVENEEEEEKKGRDETGRRRKKRSGGVEGEEGRRWTYMERGGGWRKIRGGCICNEGMELYPMVVSTQGSRDKTSLLLYIKNQQPYFRVLTVFLLFFAAKLFL